MCIVKIYILPCVILFAGMGQGEMNMRDIREIDKEKLNDYQDLVKADIAADKHHGVR